MGQTFDDIQLLGLLGLLHSIFTVPLGSSLGPSDHNQRPRTNHIDMRKRIKFAHKIPAPRQRRIRRARMEST